MLPQKTNKHTKKHKPRKTKMVFTSEFYQTYKEEMVTYFTQNVPEHRKRRNALQFILRLV